MRQRHEGAPDEVQQERGEDGLSGGWRGVCVSRHRACVDGYRALQRDDRGMACGGGGGGRQRWVFEGLDGGQELGPDGSDEGMEDASDDRKEAIPVRLQPVSSASRPVTQHVFIARQAQAELVTAHLQMRRAPAHASAVGSA
jgi:hypothetical protein